MPQPTLLARTFWSSLLLTGLTAAHGAEIPEDHAYIFSYAGASTCLGCHPETAADVMASLHWTWQKTDSATGQQVGKNVIINNYCIAVPSNEPRCTSCHIGIGYADKTFNFSDSNKIDCLVCHDTTGTYTKVPTGAGAPPASLDLLPIAQNAGKPSRHNCGVCHFYGGGADAVKHGDLDSTMENPTPELDVHMGGLGFTCQECHVTNGQEPHHIVGSRYSKSAADHALCESCHTSTPAGHSNTLNRHTDRVSCQACHIPAYARGGKPTKMWWDWSTAGQKNADGTEKVIKDAAGNVIYDTKKGNFRWSANQVPEYAWFNGVVSWVTLQDPVSPEQTVVINQLGGTVSDPQARIFPVKRFFGLQPYDTGRNRLAIPHLFGSDANALWKSYDWEKSMAAGNTYAGEPYVGPVGFLESEMVWIQNHMVAPKEQALKCQDCHSWGGRINFAALGYEPAAAANLQDMFGPPSLWPDASYPKTEGLKNAGPGWIYDDLYPFVFLYANQSGWLYIFPEGATKDSFWGYDFTADTWFWSGDSLGGWHYQVPAGNWAHW